MPKPSSTRYRTTNWSDYNASLRRRGSLSVWSDPETVWHARQTGKRGRPELRVLDRTVADRAFEPSVEA